MRELDEDLTLRRALAPEGDGVIYQGRTVHVASWAARFLFTGEQLNQPVRNLCGGERARVLIAKLMLEPADVLLLDEPTNDLDIPTLEILEENLLDFPGALVLVTHDRYLLNRVASTVLGLDGRGHTGRFADYAQWEDWLAEQDSSSRSTSQASPAAGQTAQAPAQRTGERIRRQLAGKKETLLPRSPRVCGNRAARRAVRRPPGRRPRPRRSILRSPPMPPPSRRRWSNWMPRSMKTTPSMPAGRS